MRSTWLAGLGMGVALLTIGAGAVLMRPPQPVPPPTPGRLHVTATLDEPDPTAAAMPHCAGISTQIPRPAAFPADFPLPPGTIVTSQQPLGQGVVLNGVVPASSQATAVFFNRAMPRAGLRLAFGESEAYEAESSYAGNGYQGRWLVREIPGCHAASVLAVSVQR